MYNRQIAGLEPSRSMTVMAKAKKMEALDPAIIDLAGGEPDFPTPAPICREMFRQVEQGYTHYTVGPGLPALRTRIAEKLLQENGCAYDPEGIIVTPGAKYAIYLAVRTLLNPGDRAMYLTPAWVSYPSIVAAAGGVPVPVALKFEENYRINPESLERAWTPGTRLLIINYPNNPTGRLLTKAEADVLRDFLLRHPEIYVLSDEIYERIVFDGAENHSLAADRELLSRVVTANGFSKSAAMTGWRLGYLAAETDLAKQSYKLFQHTISCVSGFIQKAGVTALDCREETESMRRRYEERRNFFIAGLNAVRGVTCVPPEGAFYAWAAFDLPGLDSEGVCEFLLQEAKVVGVPGVSYGETRRPYIRFSFAADDASLNRAVEQIRRVMPG
ncbi:pyridoxal phosphate-dependent aminotransferase [uncultured Oscillibacter sp.]|jgi:aspartate aminotransferase|uniref:pyridoxal phosphate-dependent aminotransferase n=1 Tax=uncultured Oscillibacter sp. TaxID=876091 RepID=UPI0025D80730|nr:pyridoxal phosphate-dependent aminotransferase [uncultured Oscillibacter sp.]MCI9600419.1 pyridoxal phosphate-dependent aminotransferase [Lachnospiraceae bacterium]